MHTIMYATIAVVRYSSRANDYLKTVIIVSHVMYSHFVAVVFNEATYGESKPLVLPDAPVRCVHRPWRRILINLLLL